MPENARPRRTAVERVDFRDLPEFMRSATVGAIVAEALRNHNVQGESASGAVTALIENAADEILTFHGIDSGTGVDRRTQRERDEDERETAVMHDVHGNHS